MQRKLVDGGIGLKHAGSASVSVRRSKHRAASEESERASERASGVRDVGMREQQGRDLEDGEKDVVCVLPGAFVEPPHHLSDGLANVIIHRIRSLQPRLCRRLLPSVHGLRIAVLQK